MSNDQQQQQPLQQQQQPLRPLGFRFYPTEEELLSFYLQNKLSKIREADIERVIPVADIYRLDPWQLPEISGEPCIRDSEQWFFFCPQQPREADGGRAARTTPSGYWKATGSPGLVYSSTDRARVLGAKKTMVFYRGRAHNGSKTKWKMNEYRAFEDVGTIDPGSAPKLRNEFSLCRVYKNSGCMRSFDRRPAMAATAGESSRAQNEVSSNSGNCSGYKRGRSQDSSSADDELDGSNPLLQGGDMDLKMLEEFDWDKFDWV